MKLAAWITVLVILSWAIVACIVEHGTKKRRLNRYKTRPDERDSRLYWTRTWRT